MPPGLTAFRSCRPACTRCASTGRGSSHWFAKESSFHAAYTLRFNAQLVPETIAGGTIVVPGRAPLIDVGSAQQGVVVDQDFIRTIPVARPGTIGANGRSFETLALTAPTARQDLYGVSINGTTSPENSYFIDGLSTRNPGFGISGSRLSMEFVDSVTVDTGGYQPEYGRTTGGDHLRPDEIWRRRVSRLCLGNVDTGHARRCSPPGQQSQQRHHLSDRAAQRGRLRGHARRLHHQGSPLVLRRLPAGVLTLSSEP